MDKLVITSEQWDRYLDKYGGLLCMISKKISGDLALANLEDNYSDLCIAALTSIQGFYKKTGKTFDEMIGEKLFDQYTKTVLWNAKNKKGKNLTKRVGFINKHVSITPIDDEPPFDIEDSKSDTEYSVELIQGDMFKDSSNEAKKVISAIASDPSVLSSDGVLKINALVKPTGLSPYFLKKAVEEISRTLRIEYYD